MGDTEDTTAVYVIGPHAFQNSLMRRLVQNNNFTCRTYRQLVELSDDDLRANGKRPLIFFDCQGLDRPALLHAIDGKLGEYLGCGHLIIFNVKPDHAIEKYAMQKGIKGFLYEHDDAGMIQQVIQSVANGEIWVARKKLEELIALAALPHSQKPIPALTKREKEILRLVAAGETNDQIAKRLYITRHTVKTHLHAIYKKIGSNTRLMAVRWSQQYL